MQELLGFLTLVGIWWFFSSCNKAVIKATGTVVVPTGMDLSSGGYCIQVYDGDTIKVRLPGRNVVIRLYGMDAPEEAHDSKPAQAFARESTGYLASRILNAWVTVIPVDEDPYKRMVARVYVGDEDISLTMIKVGMAEAYRNYLDEPYMTQYCQAEEQARNSRVGLWNQPRVLRPQVYRRMA